MGTVAEKLSYLADTKDLFKDRLNSLGAEITSSTTFRNYLTWLDTFYGEVSNKTDISQNGVVGRTSQNSTTGKNLIKFTDAKSYAYTNGVPINPTGHNYVTSSDNNSFSITYDSNSFIGVVSDIMELQPNTQYTISFNRTQNSNFQQRVHFLNVALDGTLSLNRANNAGVYGSPYTYTFTTGETGRTRIMISVNNSTPRGESETITNIQVELGSTATEFEPFTNGASPNPDYPQPINNLSGDVPYKVSGKNIYTGEIEYNNSVLASNGTINSATGFIVSKSFPIDISKDIYVSFVVGSLNDKIMRVGYYDSNDNFISRPAFETTPTKLTPPSNAQYLKLSYDARNLSDIQVEYNQATTYEPYIEPQTFNIPLKSKNLANLDMIGRVPSVSNGQMIDFPNGVSSDFIEVDNTKEYIFQYDFSGTNERYIFFYDEDKNFISSISGENNVPSGVHINSFNSFSRSKYIKLRIDRRSNVNWIQLEENSTATDYEPYYDIELCDIDTYEDKIYSSNGRFYLYKNIDKKFENSFTAIIAITSTLANNLYGYACNTQGISSYSELGAIISNIFVPKILGSQTDTTNPNNVRFNMGIAKHPNNNQVVITIDKKYLETGATTEFSNFLNNNNFEYYCVLATPTTTEITQENYPSLYNALKQIQDYLTAYKINKEFILGYSSPEIEY